MIKVQILIPCEHCSGQAFLPVGEEVGYTGKHYIRYRPCPQCQGSGNQPKWVDLRNLPTWLTRQSSPTRMTWRSCSPGLLPKRMIVHPRPLTYYILPSLGTTLLTDLSLIRIEKFYGHLIEVGVSTRTVRIVHTILHRALDKAVRYQLIRHNPSDGATLPRYQHGEMQVLDEIQVSQILIAAQRSPYRALYFLAVTTGMRQGELLGMKWSDLKWNSGTLQVQRQLQYVPGRVRAWSSQRPGPARGR
jgi:Phage integrase family